MAEKKKKKAMKRSLVDTDGQKKTVYIDLDTYQYIPDSLLSSFTILNDDSQTVEYVEDVNQPNVVKGLIFLEKSDPTFEHLSKAISKTKGTVGAEERPSTQARTQEPDPTNRDRQVFAPSPTSVVPDLQYDRFTPPTTANFMQTPALDYNRFAPPSRFDSLKDFPQKDEPVSARSNPVGTSTATTATDAAKTGTAVGFAALAPRGLDTGLKESYGPKTVGPASEDITNAARAAVSEVFGPGYTVNATSGERLGGSRNHSKERGALDFGVLDPQGKPVTDKASMVALGAAMGRQGFQSLGYGKGYMGPGMMHGGAMVSTRGAHGWGARGKHANRDKEVYDAFMAEKVHGAIGILPSTTTGIPTNNPSKSNTASSVAADQTKDDTQSFTDPAQEQSPLGFTAFMNPTIAPSEKTQTAKAMESTKAAPTTRGGFVPGRTAFDMATATPAQFAAYGYTTRTPEERAYMYETLAGELSPTSLKGLLAGDETAKTEFANMLTTIENRAASKNYAGKSLEKDVLAGSQYNSRKSANIETTKENYSIYGKTLEKYGTDFFSGKLTPTAWDLDMFHGAKMEKDPKWSASLIGRTDVGGHTFGENSKNYGPTDSFYGERSRWEGIQTSETRGFNPGKGEGFANYSGPNTASGSRSDTPSEGGSRFGGGGLGTPNTAARDSPSESGSKFGGGGLGTPEKSGGYDSVGTPENNNDRGGPR